MIYYEDDRVAVHNQDVMTLDLEPESIQTCITSPPYWGLRQYLFDKASVVRYDLSEDEKAYVKSELEKRGIKPHNETP